MSQATLLTFGRPYRATTRSGRTLQMALMPARLISSGRLQKSRREQPRNSSPSCRGRAAAPKATPATCAWTCARSDRGGQHSPHASSATHHGSHRGHVPDGAPCIRQAGLPPLRVEVQRDNPARRAALRQGFTFEGIFRQHMVIKGHNRDTAWFSMLDYEWPTRKGLRSVARSRQFRWERTTDQEPCATFWLRVIGHGEIVPDSYISPENCTFSTQKTSALRKTQGRSTGRPPVSLWLSCIPGHSLSPRREGMAKLVRADAL